MQLNFKKEILKLVYSKEMLESLRESPWGKTTFTNKRRFRINWKNYI